MMVGYIVKHHDHSALSIATADLDKKRGKAAGVAPLGHMGQYFACFRLYAAKECTALAPALPLANARLEAALGPTVGYARSVGQTGLVFKNERLFGLKALEFFLTPPA
jgi:hypothetical protein